MTTPLLELRGITKSFSRVPVLHRIDLKVQPGEVHALIGENGAGKSTLIKLLGGVYPPDSGGILLNGSSLLLHSPLDAHRVGIRTLYQESNLLPELTVAENIFLGSEPRHRWLPMINAREMGRKARDTFDLLGAQIAPDARVGNLTPAQQQMVELAKAIHVRASLLIMDEPTASLSQHETEGIFRVIRLLKSQGIGVIYVSHRLDEVLAIADKATILRDGRRVVTTDIAGSSTDQLIRFMSGRTLSQRFPRSRSKPGREVLRIDSLTRLPAFENISFTLRAGEIVGLAGLVGSGRSALVHSIFGYEPSDSGMIYVDGKPAEIHSPQDAIRIGIGLLPEDRQQQSLLLEMSARENLSLAALGRSGSLSGHLIDRKDEAELVQQYTQRLRIKLPNGETKVRFLSGGTQQKIVLSRWLAVQPRIMILDEPTRGIDVSAKVEIYRLLGELAAKGVAILMISAELSELVRLCDRILVMKRGCLLRTLEGTQITEEILTRSVIGEVP